MARFLWVCLGGAFGTGARYLLQGWTAAQLGSLFPYGTLGVNLLGSFLISLLMYVGLATDLFSATVRVALTTGILGGFTTYSSFCYESLVYLREGSWGLAALYVASTLMGCLAACFLGLALGRVLVGR